MAKKASKSQFISEVYLDKGEPVRGVKKPAPPAEPVVPKVAPLGKVVAHFTPEQAAEAARLVDDAMRLHERAIDHAFDPGWPRGQFITEVRLDTGGQVQSTKKHTPPPVPGEAGLSPLAKSIEAVTMRLLSHACSIHHRTAGRPPKKGPCQHAPPRTLPGRLQFVLHNLKHVEDILESARWRL